MTDGPDPATCPICGRGVLADIAFDAPGPDRQPDLRQTAESREVLTFTCGHEVPGPSMRSADADALDVERRRSAEAATPPPDEPDEPRPT
jgi:hypothetical protein